MMGEKTQPRSSPCGAAQWAPHLLRVGSTSPPAESALHGPLRLLLWRRNPHFGGTPTSQPIHEPVKMLLHRFLQYDCDCATRSFCTCRQQIKEKSFTVLLTDFSYMQGSSFWSAAVEPATTVLPEAGEHVATKSQQNRPHYVSVL